jgi:hypothetical protein
VVFGVRLVLNEEVLSFWQQAPKLVLVLLKLILVGAPIVLVWLEKGPLKRLWGEVDALLFWLTKRLVQRSVFDCRLVAHDWRHTWGSVITALRHFWHGLVLAKWFRIHHKLDRIQDFLIRIRLYSTVLALNLGGVCGSVLCIRINETTVLQTVFEDLTIRSTCHETQNGWQFLLRYLELQK